MNTCIFKCARYFPLILHLSSLAIQIAQRSSQDCSLAKEKWLTWADDDDWIFWDFNDWRWTKTVLALWWYASNDSAVWAKSNQHRQKVEHFFFANTKIEISFINCTSHLILAKKSRFPITNTKDAITKENITEKKQKSLPAKPHVFW